MNRHAEFNYFEREMIALALGKITDWKQQPMETLAIMTFVRTCEVESLREEVKALQKSVSSSGR
jgi:hypothetical protein